MKILSQPVSFFGLLFLLLGRALVGFAQEQPIILSVDATEASRRILHARMTFPVKPGPLTLLYPKWIPGEHGPTGPITDLTGLKISAEGQLLRWRRDGSDMFAFHLDVPEGTTRLEVALDFLLPPNSEGFSSGASSTAHLLDLNWNQILLYPRGFNNNDLRYTVNLRLPPGWKSGTALPLKTESGNGLEFSTVSLETLVDSPLVAGAYFRTVDLTPGAMPSHQIHIVADSAAALAMSAEESAHYAHLVAETGALFGARHYRGYHFLLTLSENVAHFGLEHHESSDNRAPERILIDDDLRPLWAGLLSHEMVHSWNGKHRRPVGLTTTNFHEPMRGELLWIYEGLTTYLGELLAARSGLLSSEEYRESVAGMAAMLDHRTGRSWRPLVDTTVAAQLLYTDRSGGRGWRRSVDFYPEGLLIWLEADTLIREKTSGQRSLDDFCRRFYGGADGPPSVRPYTVEDVVSALRETAEHDWQKFFRERVTDITPRAPLGGIEGCGWRLVYNDTLPSMQKAREAAEKLTDLNYSLGLEIKEDGDILDVVPGSPADKAGVSSDMKLVAVNGRRWKPELLRTALQEAKTNAEPIELLVENAEFFKTYRVDYHGGEKYPHLERNSSKPDRLEQILKSRTPPPTAEKGRRAVK